MKSAKPKCTNFSEVLEMDTYKVILVGDGGCGKSVFVKRVLTGMFEKKYIATLGVEVHPVRVPSRLACLNIWDCAGQEKFGGLRDGYYIQSHIAVVAFDLTSPLSLANIGTWAKSVRRIADKAPIIICGMKADIKTPLVQKRLDNLVPKLEEIGLRYVEISSKTGEGVLELLQLIESLARVRKPKL